jgi:photosystem II stability/assembly factor-like uncharacterized protein
MGVISFIATTGNGLARVERGPDGHWRVESLLAGRSVSCLAADPRQPNVVYAGTQAQGVLRSDDYGKTWQPAGLDSQVIKALAVSQSEPGVLYAGTKPPALFVSDDSGATWSELNSFRKKRAFWWFSPAEGRPFTPYVQAIALSPSEPNVILAGIELGAVLRSTDGGQTWQGHRSGALRDCHCLIAHATNGKWYYEGGGSGAGAAFSQDGGHTWQQPKVGLDRHYGWAVAADPAQPEVWYVSLSPGPFKAHGGGDAQAFIFRSSGDSGWQKLSGGLPQPLNYMPYALLTDPAAPGHLYAGLSNGDVWHSADQGDTWRQLPFNLQSIHRAMIML